MPSARGVYVPRVNHLSVVSRPLAPTDTTAIDCDLYQTAVFRPSALTGTAGHTVHQCRVTAGGTYWPCKVNMLT